MALAESIISKTKIKFRYGEPYTSEAANIQAGVNLPGAYRGGNVYVGTDSPVRSVRIITDGAATLILHRDNTNFSSTAVLETGTVTLDLSESSLWPIPAGGVLWYVYMSVDYDVNSETVGYFGVDEFLDLPTDAVKLAVIELEEGATAITSNNIRTDGTYRDKVLDKKVSLSQSLYEVSAGGASSGRFQIPHRVCFLGETSEGNGKSISLRNATNTKLPLVDASGGLISAGSWYAEEVGGVALTDSDMDRDGCYTGPWISINNDLGPTTYANAFYAAYHSVVLLGNINTSSDKPGFMGTHADDVLSKQLVGSPDWVPSGNISSQLLVLLGFLNSKIPNLTGFVANANWVLLWRSNDSADNADVDMNTVSLYYNNTGMMIVRGGYVSGTDITTQNGVTGGIIYACSVVAGEFDLHIDYRTKFAVNGTNNIPLSTTSSWDYYTKETGTTTDVYNYLKVITYGEYASVAMNAVPGTGTYPDYIEILRLSEDRVRVYYTSAADDSRLAMASGCYWDNGTQLWKRTSTDSEDANVFEISRVGISFKTKDKNASDFTTGWANTTGGWTYISIIGQTSDTTGAIRVAGEQKESFIIPATITLNSGHLLAMSSASYVGPLLYGYVNFRQHRYAAPAAGSFIFAKIGPDAVLSNYAASSITNWGAKVSCQSNILAHLDSMAVVVSSAIAGYVIVAGTGYDWSFNQIIAVRETDLTTLVWRISSFEESGGNTILTINDFNGESPMKDYVGTETLYTITASRENMVLDCSFRVNLY